jgi:phage recombination protein Bet
MNALLKRADAALPALAMDEHELIEVLRNSLYPGAQDDSIKMIIGYCRASGLDPMQKPAHIVPIWDSKAGKMRDVVMPGIGLYRTQAARSGNYAGVTEPEFGPDVIESLGGVEITYPAWCKVTVKRALANGAIVEFAAVERWKENYAVKGGKDRSTAPNAMWQKRPYGQIAKCAEAQALRKAFPEFGSAPTAEEMEGKEIYQERDITPQRAEPVVAEDVELPFYPQEDFIAGLPEWDRLIREGRHTAERIISKLQTRGVLTEKQLSALQNIPLAEVIEQ